MGAPMCGASARRTVPWERVACYLPVSSVDVLRPRVFSVTSGTVLGCTLGCGARGEDTTLPSWCASNKGALRC